MNRRCGVRWLSLLLVGVVWAGAGRRVQASNGLEPIAISSRSQGRGGADTGVGDSALSQVDNPATLTLQDCRTFDSVGKIILPRSEWVGPAGTVNSGYGVLPAFNFGMAAPLSDDLSWGWAVYTKTGEASKYDNAHLQIPQLVLTDRADLEDVAIEANLAYKITDQLSVGVGPRLEVASTRFTDVFGPAVFNFERGYAVGGGFQAGLYYKVCDTINVGVGYRSPTWCGSLDGGNAQIQFIGLLNTSADLGPVRIDNLRLPQRVSVGGSWDATDRLRLATEARWINYSDSTLNSTIIHQNGLAPLVPAGLPFPLRYKDEYVFIVGGDFKVDEHWTVRAGYNYGTPPVEHQGLLPTASVITTHNITAGLEYRKDNWWVNVGYILGLTTTLASSDVNGFLGTPNDYSASRLSLTEHTIFVGLGFNR
jgi:long-chain fatty acid transport protein